MGAPKSAMMPSPVNWLTVPSKRCTPLVRMLEEVVEDRVPALRGRSASARSTRNSFTSAKSTVTCLRSPSSADFDCKIRLASAWACSREDHAPEPGSSRRSRGHTPGRTSLRTEAPWCSPHSGRRPDSNRGSGLCRPVPYHLATPPRKDSRSPEASRIQARTHASASKTT